jgi:UDP-2-acetamido-3-amino-2,3-dideoxy-glucuronate N-acetyltransferase
MALSSPDCFVHPTAIIDNTVTIDSQTKIWHYGHVLAGSRIDKRCNIGQDVVIGPDVVIGNGCRKSVSALRAE